MTQPNFTTTITVNQSAEQVFDAVNNVRDWWTEDIDGPTDRLGAEFAFQHSDVHRSTQRITELVPGQRVVWRVVDSNLGFVKGNKHEWTGTEVVFEIAQKGKQTELRFTHVGLVPRFECFGGCSGAWGFLINDSLRGLIETGKGQPYQKS